jgi:hypothetical protein
MVRHSAVVACAVLLAGCHPYEWKIDYRQATVGHVGCAKNEIEISLDGKGDVYGDAQGYYMRVHNWRARCGGKVYFCAIQRGVYMTIDTASALTVNCHPELPPMPTWHGVSSRRAQPAANAYPDGTPKPDEAPSETTEVPFQVAPQSPPSADTVAPQPPGHKP